MITDGAPKPKVVTSLKQFIGVLEAGGRSVGLVAPKAIEEAVGHVRSAHFNALRGVDRLKGLDTGIVVGRMLPPAFDVQAKARALFPFEAMEFGENKYVRKEAGYRMRSGARVGVTEWYHPDPRVDRVLRQHREAESSQAVDRFRLVYRDAPAEIFILSPLPLDVTVDGLIHDPLGDARLLEALERSGWVLPLVSDWLHGRMPDLFASEKAAKCWSLNAYRRTSHAPPAKNAENGASGPKKASEVLLGSMAHSSIDIYIEKRAMLPSSTKPGDDPLGLVRAYRFRLRRRHHLVSAQKLPRVLSTLSSEATHRRLGEHSPGDEVVELTDTGAPCPIIRVVDHRALENRL